MSDSTDSSRGYLDVLVGPKRQCMSSQTSSPRSCSELETDSKNWTFGSRMQHCAETLQNTDYAKGEDYQVLRKAATRHYDAMKSYYEKVATAYSNGQRSYASYLSE
ncbi:hypothetical protein IFM89_029157 [Coptis chinensis]|uniref:DUF1771 domain-containing protein n=1 Tax=Coptis chinensis TaxID=261450 RepID=A0A835MA07_9MAGN|nr:hypothetical protein IFM89_029157 [Coptis chinensis]